jgi:hypothetical protein
MIATKFRFPGLEKKYEDKKSDDKKITMISIDLIRPNPYQPISYIGKRTVHNNAHRIINKGLLHFSFDIDWNNSVCIWVFYVPVFGHLLMLPFISIQLIIVSIFNAYLLYFNKHFN